MNLDSLEGSIQNLLSVLYPPFEATAPTLLSQLFQIVDSRYRGDALRCLLDFLVPAKHILDTVQQAACGQYTDVLFLCEGWPLCLRDQVVVHLAPINPALLQSGDFYLQVAPFCDQSARIVVCSLLEEAGFRAAVVEETPIPETSYPCIFSREWLEEINDGRRGAPLSQCLLATEQGVVRLPWERVAVPEFVEAPQSARSSMASAPPSLLPSSNLLPLPPSLPDSSENSASNKLVPNPPAFSDSPKESVVKHIPAINSSLTSSPSTALSVETRICPARHGIAVSLCLVDTTAASSTRLIKEPDAEPKPIGWVSPNTWDSRFTGTHTNTTTKLSTVSDKSKGETKEVSLAENTEKNKSKHTNQEKMSRSETATHLVAEGEYIDVVQAKMLFGRAHSLPEQQHRSLVQPHSQTEMQMHKHPQRRAQTQQMESQRQTQREPGTHISPHIQRRATAQLPTKPQAHSHSRPTIASKPNMSAEPRPASTLHHSQPHHPHSDSVETFQCVRTVRFSEKPCTPCMRRRQGGKVSRAQELRCRYRDSYQAAIENPVAFAQEKERGTLAVVAEDGDFSYYDGRPEPPDTETRDPWCAVQSSGSDPGIQTQLKSHVGGAISEESKPNNTFPYWKTGNTNSAPCMDYRATCAVQFVGLREQARTALTHSEPQSANSVKSSGNLHNVNGPSSAAGTWMNPTEPLRSSNGAKEPDASTKHCGLPLGGAEISRKHMNLRTEERPQTTNNSSGLRPNTCLSPTTAQTTRNSLSDGRCSSLSTAVVDTSEKCELVIVEGQNVRRREKTDTRPEIPQLHVVKCKNSTAFRLVSPKINRRKMVIPEAAQPVTTSIMSQNHHEPETDPLPAVELQKFLQRASARPRPDHLPLGSPDPGAHPVYLGVASLTGCRDRVGRAIVELYGDHLGWRSAVTSQELFQMLLYFHTITRKEIREAGMTLIFDARKMNPPPQLYKALMTLKEVSPPAVNSLVLLVDKESNNRPERCPGIQTDVMTSMKALVKLVDVSQLSSRLDGASSHSYCDWMELHQKLFPFVYDLHEASSLLLRAISKLEEPQRTNTVQNVQQCMADQRTLMKDVLEDNRLVSLQRDGGSILARLRKESDLKYPHCEDLSDAVDSVTSLYNHVEEQAHVLVQRSNMSLEHLEYLQQLREMEGHFTQIQQWFNVEGERHLLEAESVEESGDIMENVLSSFTGFLIEANDRRHHAMSLVSEAECLQQSPYPEAEAFTALICSFKAGLEDFLCRAEACGRELQVIVNVCDFCEQATALATECMDYLDQNQPRVHSAKDPDSASQIHQLNQPTQCQPQDSSFDSNALPLCQPDSQAQGPNPSSTTLSFTDSSILHAFQDRFVPFSLERFQEMKAQASALRGSRGMRVWNVAWLKCQEARQQLQERIQDMEDVVYPPSPDSSSWQEGHFVDVGSTNIQTVSPGGQSLVVQSTPGPQHPQWEDIVSGAVDLGKRRPILGSNGTNSTTLACCNIIIKPENHSEAGNDQGSKVTPQSPQRSARRTERETRRRQMSRARSERDAAALSQSHTVGCQWFPWGRGLRTRSVSQDSCSTRVATAGSSTPPEQRFRPPSSCSHHGQPSCRILQEAQKFQLSRHGSFCSEDSCMSDRGAAGGTENLSCKHSSLPIGGYEGTYGSGRPQENTSNNLRLQRVMEELVFTEREYVRSLGYILTHYLPLMDRLDIPQDLRGKRGVIFGNLEKLYDFHSHYFLPELEACQREPAMVARCFLRHSESFSLYALYSKNKPQSDALILHRRHDIFKRKQQELGDMMDLSSYLLRPIQRISKYSLLLQDILGLAASYRPKDTFQDPLFMSSVCGPSEFIPDLSSGERERERAEIQAAADLVRFQMRHGNDLLTMDAIQDCDVNLKEQGQLIRQDEFTVFFRKKKCIRRIFLFEDLILFSKTKRTDVGNDVYVYKQSFKTSDIGMTHNSGMSALCFEIWFRRRKSEDTYTLKASSTELKKAWTTDLERILWNQATHSRELRIQERVFMGMGRKPFMDIQPSDAAICDRAVGCVPPGRTPVACCSHRDLDYPRPHSIGSGSTASTTLSQSSSSSGRGSLPPAGFPGTSCQGVDTSPVICSSPEAAADNEINDLHLYQHHLHRNCELWKSHRPLLDSTESSGECTNLFSSTERSCLSAISGEVVDDSSFVSQSSQPNSPICRTPSLRINGSPALPKKKPGVVPKPPHLANAVVQSDEILLGKSTEV